MFRSLRFSLALEFVANPTEWQWFGPMVARGTYHYDTDGWPVFPIPQIQQYKLLWNELAGRALVKLQEGDWTAEGVSPAHGVLPITIHTALWDYLRIVDRMDEAEGGGFRFIALTVSGVATPKVGVSQASKATLRRQLTDWIRSHAEAADGTVLRDDQMAAARAAFVGCVITDNMFRDCRRDANLGDESVQKGRPKAKGLGK